MKLVEEYERQVRKACWHLALADGIETALADPRIQMRKGGFWPSRAEAHRTKAARCYVLAFLYSRYLPHGGFDEENYAPFSYPLPRNWGARHPSESAYSGGSGAGR